MHTARTTADKPSGNAAILKFEPREHLPVSRTHHRPHVYRNVFMGTWICDHEGTRASPGPDSARTVYRTHLDAVRAAIGMDSAEQDQRLSA